jgi:beta-carotene 3-hydroxylase
MTTLAFDIVLFLAAFAFMEGFAWVTHRYVMHGFMWAGTSRTTSPARGCSS